ncbi:MAG: AI-2E family transporter [Verrucomicrobiaceae bacterium]|nr:MAG: AI-2E family transporter [Verrucomicrobiaceae bacterium]
MDSNETPHQSSEHKELWRFAQKLFFVVAAVLLVWLWIAFTQVWLLVFAAALLAIVLNRAACFISKHTPISRRWALGLVSLIIVALVLLIGWRAVPAIGEQFRELGQSVPASFEKLQQQLRDYTWGKEALKAANQAESYLPNEQSLQERVAGIFSSTVGALGGFLFIVFIAYCFAIEPELYAAGILHLVPKHQRTHAKEVFAILEDTLAMWILARAASMTLVGILLWLALWALGIPLAFILALLGGLLDFIPNVGPFIAAAPAILLAFIISPTKALYVAIAYLVIQMLEAYIITPIIERKTVQLAPALTATVQILLGLSVGILGVALGAPLTLTTLVLMKKLYVREYLHDKSVGAVK